MSEDIKHDWQEVVELAPKGDFETQDGARILRGPVEEVSIDEEDNVLIQLKWAATMPTPGDPGFGEWTLSPIKVITFPNLVQPFVIEDTPEKGKRVRFNVNILYLEKTGEGGLDPARVKGLDLTSLEQSPTDNK